MGRSRILVILLLTTTWAIGAESSRRKPHISSDKRLAKKIDGVLRASPVLARGHIGYRFADAETGAVLADQSGGRLFTPASNVKLYTTALALVRLGAGYRFRTQVRTSGTWLPGQDTVADLQLIGGGDPNLSGRTLPYAVGAPEGDPLAALEQIADALASAGIRKVIGDVIGVATRYGAEVYPDGWTLDDSVYEYGAPVSALTINDNAMALILRPTEAGNLTEVELRPAVPHFIIDNQVVTDHSSEAHVQVKRAPGSNEIVLSGSIGQRADQWRTDIAADDAALVAAESLVALLRERGIEVNGEARARYTAGPLDRSGTTLTERSSQPLAEILQVVNKVSQNLHSEMLLREVAVARTGIGSPENGGREREIFLNEAGVTREGTGYAIDDGSGLARQDLITPESTVQLLRYMWMRPEREVWVNTLPIGGVDGSLQHRFHNIAGADRVRAKTGSLTHVNTLSGYIETRSHRTIAFSVMVNATSGPEKEVRDAIDRLCAVFLNL